MDLFPDDDLGSVMEEDLPGRAHAGWRHEGIQSSPVGGGGPEGGSSTAWGHAVAGVPATLSGGHFE